MSFVEYMVIYCNVHVKDMSHCHLQCIETALRGRFLGGWVGRGTLRVCGGIWFPGMFELLTGSDCQVGLRCDWSCGALVTMGNGHPWVCEDLSRRDSRVSCFEDLLKKFIFRTVHSFYRVKPHWA